MDLLTADWVGWYSTTRLMHRLGRIPPMEYEANYYDQQPAAQPAAHQ